MQQHKKSAIKNYGDIAQQLLPQSNTFDPSLQVSHPNGQKVFRLHDKKGSIPMSSLSSQNSYRGMHSNYFQSQAHNQQNQHQRQGNHPQQPQLVNQNQNGKGESRNFSSNQYQNSASHKQNSQQPQNVYQNGLNSQVGSPAQGQQLISNAMITQKHGFGKF